MRKYYKDDHRYDDIIYLPHHRSAHRTHMSLHDRAAQFAPFAALTGHEDAIEETARLTEERITLDESAIARINEKLCEIAAHLEDRRPVSITYFRPDSLKSGGAYLIDIGTVKKLDEVEKKVIMDSGICIPMDQIVSIN